MPARSPQPLLFQVGQDLFQILCTWLPLKSVSNLDIAISNADDRLQWMRCLGMMDANVINQYSRFGHSFIRWLITKGVRTTCIRIEYDFGCGVNQINDTTFSGFGFPPRQLDIDSMKTSSDYTGGLSIKDCVIVDLTSCRVTDMNVIDLARGCPQLHTVILRQCSELTDECLIELARWCPRLHTIDIFCVENITNVGVSALCHVCCELRSIDLAYNKNISDVSVAILASCCPLLHTISFDCSEDITGTSLQALALNCPELENVTLYSWTEEELSAFASACPQMKNLSLGPCPGMSDDFISELEKRFPNISVTYDDYYSDGDGGDDVYDGCDYDVDYDSFGFDYSDHGDFFGDEDAYANGYNDYHNHGDYDNR